MRGFLLHVLQAQVNRDRGDKEDFSSYLDEDVIYLQIGRRYPQTREMMRGHLYYLYDRRYAKFHEVKVAGKKFLLWRITADGTDVLDGVKDDRGVQVE